MAETDVVRYPAAPTRTCWFEAVGSLFDHLYVLSGGQVRRFGGHAVWLVIRAIPA
jgi:hypothetical protein